MITVEIWSDFVCPYCFVGKKRFDLALAELTDTEREQVNVVFRTFRLDATKDPYDGQGLKASFIASGMTPEKADRALLKVAALGAEAGLDFNLDLVKPTNTTDAHRLAKLARTISPVAESSFATAVFEAYFVHGQVISEPETLISLASKAGIDPGQARAVLADPQRFKEAIEQDEKEAYDVYFEVVPHFYIDRKYELSAVHPVEIYFEALKRALLEA